MPQTYKYKTIGHTERTPGQYADWRTKLALGETFEARVRHWLTTQGYENFKPQDNTYDLRINMEVPLYGTLPLTGECKWDFAAESTGNLALQTWDGGRPSGIHPKGPCPHLWFHGVGYECWIVRTKTIQSLVATHAQTWGGRVIPMGDRSERAEGVLMPIDVARKAVGGQWITLTEEEGSKP